MVIALNKILTENGLEVTTYMLCTCTFSKNTQAKCRCVFYRPLAWQLKTLYTACQFMDEWREVGAKQSPRRASLTKSTAASCYAGHIRVLRECHICMAEIILETVF